jgi:DNA polymerase-3 subunit epsilon
MAKIDQEHFVCIDCETTGLDPLQDKIIEVAVVQFTISDKEPLASFESLIDPQCLISPESMAIHHITDEMVQGKPVIKNVLSELFKIIGRHTIVGHGVNFDIDIIAAAADRAGVPHTIKNNRIIDTLRMARLYGESPTNSLEQLRKHFNIPLEGAHRAMSDVIVNVEVFKYLAKRYHSTEEILRVLSNPILMKIMPLGKHKGRPLKEIPIEYLRWAANKDFDQDLLFSLRSEINKRKKGNLFSQAGNPFVDL